MHKTAHSAKSLMLYGRNWFNSSFQNICQISKLFACCWLNISQDRETLQKPSVSCPLWNGEQKRKRGGLPMSLKYIMVTTSGYVVLSISVKAAAKWRGLWGHSHLFLHALLFSLLSFFVPRAPIGSSLLAKPRRHLKSRHRCVQPLACRPPRSLRLCTHRPPDLMRRPRR